MSIVVVFCGKKDNVYLKLFVFTLYGEQKLAVISKITFPLASFSINMASEQIFVADVETVVSSLFVSCKRLWY